MFNYMKTIIYAGLGSLAASQLFIKGGPGLPATSGT